MQNIKNVILIISLCFTLFLFSCEKPVSDAEKAEQVFGKEIINKYKDYDKKPVWAISRDIIDKLKSGEYDEIEEYIDYLVVRKPYTINGTRVLEDVYQFVSNRLYSSDLLDKWCAKTPSHHSSFIFRGYYFVSEAWRTRGSGFSYTVSDEGWNGFRENLKLAEKDLEKAHSINPEDPNSAAFMITVYMGQTRDEEEVDIWFNRAIKADPIGNNAYIRKQTYLEPKWHGTEKKYKKFAEYCYKKAPRNSVIHEGMLDFIIENSSGVNDIKKYYGNSHIKKIIDDIVERTYEIFPDSILIRSKLAKMENQMSNYEKAVGFYSQILKIDPDNPEALRLRGNTYGVNLKKYDLWETDIKRSFESDPNVPYIYYELAEIASYHNNYEKAEEYYTKSIERLPKYNRFYIKRGILRMSMEKDYTSALADFKKAEKLDNRFIHTYRCLAICLEELKQFEEAKKYARKALDLIGEERLKGDGGSISSEEAESYTIMLRAMLKRLTGDSNSITKAEALELVNEKDENILTLSVTSLTPEIAKILLQTRRMLSFPRLESISPDVAEILGQHIVGIDLSGIKELDYRIATGLSKNKEELNLSGVKVLSPEAAKELGGFSGGSLKLNGLETLSPDAAASIAKCNSLELNGLTDLSEETISALNKNKGSIFLEGIKQLTPEKARLFIKHEGEIWFTGMTELSPEVVKHISKHNGVLGFPRVKEISIEEAKYFGKQHKGLLNLGDISNLSDEAARALCDHDGPIELYNLTTITPSIAELLLKKASPNITFQASSITPEVAEILAKHTGVLFFDSLTEIDAKTARNLAKHKEEITLMGIKEVSPEVMEIVRGSHGFMRLSDNVKIISKN
jgi:tetratricopeptide (TPR) repeat protein